MHYNVMHTAQNIEIYSVRHCRGICHSRRSLLRYTNVAIGVPCDIQKRFRVFATLHAVAENKRAGARVVKSLGSEQEVAGSDLCTAESVW